MLFMSRKCWFAHGKVQSALEQKLWLVIGKAAYM